MIFDIILAVILDLSDASGNVKRLADNLQSYANVYLDGRETYWLIKVESK